MRDVLEYRKYMIQTRKRNTRAWGRCGWHSETKPAASSSLEDNAISLEGSTSKLLAIAHSISCITPSKVRPLKKPLYPKNPIQFSPSGLHCKKSTQNRDYPTNTTIKGNTKSIKEY